MSVNSSMTQYQLRRYFYQKAASELTPLSGTFELTPRCNMNCRMCYIRMSESEMRAHGREHSAEEWIELGKKCADHGTLFLLFTGGEPFLRKDFREIYTELKKLGLMISINTNATLIDEETVHWLSENAPSKISVTLYGGSNETYARLCGHPHGFDAATRAIDMMKEAGLLVHINSSFTRYNVADITAIAQFAHSRELRVSSATTITTAICIRFLSSVSDWIPMASTPFTWKPLPQATRLQTYMWTVSAFTIRWWTPLCTP